MSYKQLTECEPHNAVINSYSDSGCVEVSVCLEIISGLRSVDFSNVQYVWKVYFLYSFSQRNLLPSSSSLFY